MANLLSSHELQANFLAVPTLNDRVREKLRTEKDRLEMTENDIAGIVGWSQSKVAQKLRGRTPITLDELEAFCFAFGMQPTEAVRDPGLEFVTEMTPTELRIYERIRKLNPDQKTAIMTILNVQPVTVPRRALPPKDRGPRPRGR